MRTTWPFSTVAMMLQTSGQSRLQVVRTFTAREGTSVSRRVLEVHRVAPGLAPLEAVLLEQRREPRVDRAAGAAHARVDVERDSPRVRRQSGSALTGGAALVA